MTTGYTLHGYAILTPRDTWPIRVPNYRGACRGFWWPLREHEKHDGAARKLSDTLQDELLAQAPSLPHATSNEEVLRKYVEAAEALKIPLYGLLCGSPVAGARGSSLPSRLQPSCEYLGIDICYPSGSYSFSNGAYFSRRGSLVEFLKANLNQNGVLSTAASAQEFLRRYQLELDRGANFEALDDALPIELWHDAELTALKKFWKR